MIKTRGKTLKQLVKNGTQKKTKVSLTSNLFFYSRVLTFITQTSCNGLIIGPFCPIFI